MLRITLRELEVFAAIGRTGRITAAGDELGLSQSAASGAVAELERRLGVALFDRIGRRVVLNSAGQALLRSVQSALATLDDGVQAAAAAAGGEVQRLRVTVLPSFANRWLLPRIGRWRERHPALALEIETSMHVVDLNREGFHAAVRQGIGPWAGLASERLFEQPSFILVGSASAARRLEGAQPEAFAREPLIGDNDLWELWFAAAGVRAKVRTVATFNDAGLMLQAVEQNLGLALAREIHAADALVDGRLVRLSPITVAHADAQPYHLVYPPALRDWPPLDAFRRWLRDELDLSLEALKRATGAQASKQRKAGRASRATRRAGG